MCGWRFALAGGLVIATGLASPLAMAEEPPIELQREMAKDRDPNIYTEEPGSEIPAYRTGDEYEGADLDPPGSPESE